MAASTAPPQNTVLLGEFLLNGGQNPWYFGTRDWYSQPGDSIGVRHYAGRMVGVPTIRLQVSAARIWRSGSSLSFGGVRLQNPDGALTEMLQQDSRDCEFLFRLVELHAPYSESIILARGLINEIRGNPNGEDLDIQLRGYEGLLERETQLITYGASVPNTDIEGELLPTTIGQCFQVEPTPYDRTGLEFQLADTRINAITEVYSGGSLAVPPGVGSQWTYNADRTGFVMSVTPGARVVANLVGGGIVGADVLSDDGEFVEAVWTAGEPANWSESTTGSPAYSIDESDIGARFHGSTASMFHNRRLVTDANVLTNGSWYAVVGKVSRNLGGGLQFLPSGTTVDDEGEFSFVFQAKATGPLSITHNYDIAGTLDVYLEYVYVYALSDASAMTLTQAVRHLAVVRGAMPAKRVDLSSYSGPDPEVGLHTKSPLKVSDALERIMRSVTGWYWVDADGTLRIGRLAKPNHAGTPDFVANESTMTSYPVRRDDNAPGLSNRFHGAPNFSPYSEEELTGITYDQRDPFKADHRIRLTGADVLHRNYKHAKTGPPIETYSVDETELQTEADRVTGIYRKREDGETEGVPVFFDFKLSTSTNYDAASIKPETEILLDHETFGEYYGKIGVVIAASLEANNNEVAVTVWSTLYD